MSLDWKRIAAQINPRELFGNFVQGLFLLVPLVVTAYVLLFILKVVDGWLNLPIPGLGLIVTVAGLVVVGRLASNVFVKGAIEWFERLLARAPLINLLYNSIRDVVSAFVGKRRQFDQPVLVTISEEKKAKMVGFITRRDLGFLNMPGHIAVYIPHAYNISGHVVLLPKERVEPIGVSSAEMMSFVVSGGVAGGGRLSRKAPSAPAKRR